MSPHMKQGPMYRFAPDSRAPRGRLITVFCLAAAVALTGCTGNGGNPIPENASKVLQAVAVTAGSDSTVERLTSTVVATVAGSGEDVTATVDHSPADAVAELPVRVLTSYRAGDKWGTDLSELKGHDGRIEIELTVENLTGVAREVSFDADGQSISQQALVSAPLTVVASTELSGVSPDQVVTASADAATPLTNGILSQTSQGHPVVQWATILAPPTLPPTAALRLVIDASDFQVPTFVVSVQPGLVADPSISALVGSTFGSSDTLELQTRTVAVVGDVTAILSKASKVISRVRKNLEDTSATLGSKTVADLKASSTSVTTSMEQVSAELDGLSADLEQSLGSTRDSLLDTLSQTVAAIDELLGDTSASPATPEVSGEGCAASVAAPASASSVYGYLMEVIGQLDGYSSATKACKLQIQQSLLDSIGPGTPDATSCLGATSATCSLFSAQQSFGEVVTTLLADGESAVQALQPEVMVNTRAAFDELSAQVDLTFAAAAGVDSDAFDATLSALDLVDQALDDIEADLSGLSDQVDHLHDEATAARADENSLTTQGTSLADELCSRAEAGEMSVETANALRAYLVSSSCPAADGSTTVLALPSGVPAPLVERIEGQVAAWDDLISALDTDSASGLGGELAAFVSDIETARDAVVEAMDAATGAGGDQEGAAAALTSALAQLVIDRDSTATRLAALEVQQSTLEEAVRTAFSDAAANAEGVSSGLDPTIRQLRERAEVSAEELGVLFDKAGAGLADAASGISADAGEAIEEQKAQAHSTEEQASAAVTAQVANQIKTIDAGVTSATKDLDGASALLAADLRAVLLDLGERKVKGPGLLGAMATSAATAGSADYQVALATQSTTSFANLRASDIAGILFGQAQSTASLEALAELPAFDLQLPPGAEHRTVYTFTIGQPK